VNGDNSVTSGEKLPDEIVTTAGVVEMFWDSGDAERHLLVHIHPDDVQRPDAYELTGELRDSVIGTIEEGSRIEIDYLVEHHEIVDPDSATTVDSHRPKILAVRILGGN
jgi:hypothetical protein